ncbi:hypothetical protein ACRC7T_18515 [Segnochrobactraceae bacterium EtOH-i3]
MPDTSDLKDIGGFARNAEKHFDAALDLVIAAKLAVRGVDDSDVTTGLGCLLELIAEHLYEAEKFRDRLANIYKENTHV